jgi:hypothetical protein
MITEKMVSCFLLVSTQCSLSSNQGLRTLLKDGGGNANAAIVAAKIALMSTMATVLQIQQLTRCTFELS